MANETILIVDDQSEIVHFLTHYCLEPLGYNTLSAHDGEKGLKSAVDHRPDLIMLDMNMPRMTGIEMLPELRQTDCVAPVIFMTIYGSEQIAVEAFRLGVRDYLSKPFTVDEVQNSVNRALRESRLAREKEQLKNNLMAAETVRQTVVTLSHYINNHLMIVDGGLRMLGEAVEQGRSDDAILQNVVTDSLSSADTIGAVMRVLRKVTDIREEEYSSGVGMIDIKEALQAELRA
jgi:two-component system NtrC family sensor kinase